MIHKDFRLVVNTLVESIDILTEEIVALKAHTPRPETPIPIAFKVAKTKPLEVDPATGLPLLTVHLPPLAPAAMWSTVVKKGRKKTNNHSKSTRSSTTAEPP